MQSGWADANAHTKQSAMKKISLLIALGLTLPLTALGQSAKVTAKVADLSQIVWAQDWVPIMVQDIKTSNKKDLIITPSLEVGLVTKTSVSSKQGALATALATAGVEVKVMVDGKLALPSNLRTTDPEPNEAWQWESLEGVIYSRRTQELSAAFQGICITKEGTVLLDTACDYEMVQLVLSTLAAHSFTFVLPDVESGMHKVAVMARIVTKGTGTGDPTYTITQSDAKAFIGLGTVTVESTRMIKGEDVVSMD
jgi:hypothetical protein